MASALKKYFSKIEESFLKSCKGQEDFNIVIWYWGIAAYVVALFLVDWLVIYSKFAILDVIISLSVCVYFVWHLFIIHKCKPKKTKLSKVEKKIAKQKARHQSAKVLLQKLFLQRPIGQWNSVVFLTVCDLYMVSHFLSYVL